MPLSRDGRVGFAGSSSVCKKNNEKLTAYSRIIPCDDCTKIGRVVVTKEARGSGLAKKLMLQAVENGQNFANSNKPAIVIPVQEIFYEMYCENNLFATIIECAQCVFNSDISATGALRCRERQAVLLVSKRISYV